MRRSRRLHSQSVIGPEHRDRTSEPWQPALPGLTGPLPPAQAIGTALQGALAALPPIPTTDFGRMTWRLATTSRAWALRLRSQIPPGAPHGRFNHRRRFAVRWTSRDFPLDENGFYQQSHPLTRDGPRSLRIAGPLLPRRASETTSDDFRVSKASRDSRAHVHS